MTSEKVTTLLSTIHPFDSAIAMIDSVVIDLRMEGEVGTTSVGGEVLETAKKFDVENSTCHRIQAAVSKSVETINKECSPQGSVPSMFFLVSESRCRVMAYPAFFAFVAWMNVGA